MNTGGSLIDRNSNFNGVFRTSRDLYVEGEYEGEIYCEGTLTIAESANFSGSVEAGIVSVAGTLQGEVTCAGRFEILPTGQVSARVVSGSIIVRDGAFYEGEMRMHSEPPGLPEREYTHNVVPPVKARGQNARSAAAAISSEAPQASRNGVDVVEAQSAAGER
jgi:cytoskeletal protein CcmA (bactofilin family)